MLFNADTARRIRGGEITLLLRKWQRPQARVGGVYYLRPDGAVEVTSMPETRLGDLPEDDVRLAGYLDRAQVASTLAAGEDDAVWVVRFDFHANLTRPVPGRGMVDDGELETLGRKLARKNENSSHGPWTRATLTLIGDQPAVVSTRLAEQLGRDRLELKRDVRKLKSLGLTISLEVGYRLSDKGRALLDWLNRQ